MRSVRLLGMCGLWLMAVIGGYAQADLGARIEVSNVETRSTLDRMSGQVETTAEVQLLNQGDRDVEAPLHVVVRFSGEGGTVLDASGGPGTQPYDSYYLDLSERIVEGLAPQTGLNFTIRYRRPAGSGISYTLQVFGTINEDPVASLSVVEAEVVGVPLSFDAGESFDPDGSELRYFWEFGDGATSESVAPLHFYALPGIYTVRLRVVDGKGASGEAQRTVRILPPGEFALARVRVLDGSGQPLASVRVEESVDGEWLALESTDSEGLFIGSGTAGTQLWRFIKSGYLPAWRAVELRDREVVLVASPWMAAAAQRVVPVSPLEAVTVGSAQDPAILSFAAGAFVQPGTLLYTILDGQTLPLPLPLGWSPLAALHFTSSSELLEPGALTWQSLRPAVPGEVRVIAYFNAEQLQWIVQAVDEEELSITPVVQTGTWALVSADPQPTAPPVTEAGLPLPASSTPQAAVAVRAEGAFVPPQRVASLDATALITRGQVVFEADEPLVSGRVFRADIAERYALVSGGGLRTPDYDTTFFAYRDSAEREPNRLKADFAFRPSLVVDPAELSEALLLASILDAEAFTGTILDAEGGLLATPLVRISVPAGSLTQRVVAELRDIDAEGFSGLSGGLNVLRAFQLIAPQATGEMVPEFKGLPIEQEFVLARLVSVGSRQGLQPVLRMRSDAGGIARSVEPTSGTRLFGLNGGGRYVLLAVPARLGLVTGVARALDGAARAGLLAGVVGQPWLSPTATSGAFVLVATVGEGIAEAEDPTDANRGVAAFDLANGDAVAAVEIQIVETGPRVVSSVPADGASNVNAVAPLQVTFSEPVDPASFGPDALLVVAAGGGEPVAGSLGLNAAGTQATFLPTNPLSAGTSYEIQLAADIQDLSGLPIEGELRIGFQTQASATRGLGAELTIYEPGAASVPAEVLGRLVGYAAGAGSSHVVATGGPGTADAGVPVILVNETSGETATVLSGLDGSFSGFINADEADLVSAVFINANDTRVQVPVSRQLFDDGRVGLYRQGGILEAESDGGPVQVLVEPEAVAERSVFRLNTVPLLQLIEILQGVQLSGDGRILGGLQLDVDGDPLAAPVEVRFPVDVADLDLPPGVAPEQAGYALLEQAEVEGIPVFNFLDKMEYADGELHTASPPFIGFIESGLALISKFTNGNRAVVSGRAFSTNGNRNPAEGEHVPVPGAQISAHSENSFITTGRRIVPGETISITNRTGGFAMLVEANLLQPTGFVLTGLSARVPGVVGFGSTAIDPNRFPLGGEGVVLFDRTRINSTLSADTAPPQLTVQADGAVAATGVPFGFNVSAVDSGTIADIDAKVLSVTPIGVQAGPDGEPLPPPTAASVVVTRGPLNTQSGGLGSRRFTFQSEISLRAQLEFSARDAANNTAKTEQALEFGAAPSLPPALVDDPNDFAGPYVLNGLPIHRDPQFDRFRSFILQFNEPLNPDFATRVPFDAVQLTPFAGEPRVALSSDQTTLTLTYPALKPATGYTLSVQRNKIRDIKGNPHNQNNEDVDNAPVRAMRDYTVDFTTAADFSAGLNVQSGGGLQRIGNHLYALDRLSGAGSRAGVLVVHAIEAGNLSVAAEVDLPPFPRAIVAIPNWSFIKDGAPILNRDLIAIAGGLAGDFGWLRIFDVTNPGVPVFVAGKSLTNFGISLVTKLAWSPPTLGMLEISDTNVVHLIDLQLMIYARFGIDLSAEPLEGDRGLDADGNGDYVGPGDRIPRPRRDIAQSGLINAGLVASFGIVEPNLLIQDFAIAFGGRFVGVVTDRERTGSAMARYQTLAAAGAPVLDAFTEFNETARRVALLFGINARQIRGETRLANFALVSHAEMLSIVDISDPFIPPILSDRVLFPDGETVHSAQLTASGLVAVATSYNLYLLDPRDFGSGSSVGVEYRSHPALRHISAGAGTRSFAYHADGRGFAAVSLGGENRVVSKDVLEPDFTVQALSFTPRADGPPPSGPFAVAGPGKPRVPSDGLIELVIKDESVVPPSTFGIGGILKEGDKIKDSLPFNFRLNVPAPDKPFQERTFIASLSPPNLSPPPAYPEWHFGQELYFGPRVNIKLPRYSGPRPPAFPFPGIELKFWNESTFRPDMFTVACEDKSIQVNIYPSQEQRIDVNLGTYLKNIKTGLDLLQSIGNTNLGPVRGRFNFVFFNAASDRAKAKVAPPFPAPAQWESIGNIPVHGGVVLRKETSSGKFAGPDLESIAFGFGNSFKECDDDRTGLSHRVFLTYEAKAAFSPLLKAEGELRFQYRIPAFPIVTLEAYFGLSGSFGMDVSLFRDKCNQRKGCASANGALGMHVGLKPAFNIVGIDFIAVDFRVSTGLTLTAKICTDFDTNVTLEGSFDFTGISGTATISLLAGTLSRVSEPVVLVPPINLFGANVEPIVLHEFKK